MTAPARKRRGGPLVALGAIMVFWVAGRVTVLGLEAPGDQDPFGAMQAGKIAGLASPLGKASTRPELFPEPALLDSPGILESAPAYRAPMAPPLARPIKPAPYASAGAHSAPEPAAVSPVPVNIASGHQLAWMAALSRMPLPVGLTEASPQALAAPVPFTPAPFASAGRKDNPSRWSADGWLFLRQGSGGALVAGAAPASYGASQVGAVLRYRLAPASRRAPQAYLRLAAALDRPADKEAAAGLSLRPLAALPLRAMAELRVSDQSGATRLRPAALVVTEIQPIDLPHQVRAEFYGQAGYVGGRNSTAFADGQARLDRPVASLGKAQLRAGAGAWGGAQKGAARLDLGPSASLGLPIGETGSARLGLDWRMRVAGDARPGSGVALTLSAGF
jgi:hypothetical protein